MPSHYTIQHLQFFFQYSYQYPVLPPTPRMFVNLLGEHPQFHKKLCGVSIMYGVVLYDIKYLHLEQHIESILSGNRFSHWTVNISSRHDCRCVNATQDPWYYVKFSQNVTAQLMMMVVLTWPGCGCWIRISGKRWVWILGEYILYFWE